jgi:cephalosporin hydroxylase
MSEMIENLDMTLRELIPRIQDRLMQRSHYFGVPAQKFPFDFWEYQEILWETKPEVIIEIGNNCGGSTLALAHLCDALGKGKIIGVDVSHERVPDHVRNHPRIELITGDACAVFSEVRSKLNDGRIMVIEDSSHTMQNTLNILRLYGPLVSPGCYFIVEDGICWHGLDRGPAPGPLEAVEVFLAETQSFQLDARRESFVLTWNPKGYLLRVDRSTA